MCNNGLLNMTYSSIPQILALVFAYLAIMEIIMDEDLGMCDMCNNLYEPYQCYQEWQRSQQEDE